MKRIAVFLAVSMLLFAVAVQAQNPAPRPGPEHKKLGVFLGLWSVDVEVKRGNGYGVPAGKFTRIERCQWLPGEFFLQVNREGKGPLGEFKDMIIYGYNPVTRKYTGAYYDLPTGGFLSATVTNTGDTWVWSASGHSRDGKPYHERCNLTMVPNVSYTTKCETSPDGKAWSPSAELKGTLSKP